MCGVTCWAEWPLEGSRRLCHAVVTSAPFRGATGMGWGWMVGVREQVGSHGKGKKKALQRTDVLFPSLHSPVYPLPGRSVTFE